MSGDERHTSLESAPRPFSRSETGAHGWIKVLGADVLGIPAGLAILIYLTRRLGPSGYGVFALATTAVLWVEWSLAALFGRAAVKLMSETADWRAYGTALIRLQIGFGTAVGVAAALLASPLAEALGAPELTPIIRILSLDLPLFMWAQSYRSIAVGQGRYVTRASLSAFHQIARVSLMVVLVEMGFSIRGAVASLICTSALDVGFGWWRTGLSPFGRGHIDRLELWRYAVPTFLFAGSLRLFDKIDLFMLQSIGGSVALTGIYGAAQRASYIPTLIAGSFAPLLLASMSTLRTQGSEKRSRSLGSESLRLLILLLPFAVIVSVTAEPLIRLFLGPGYSSSGSLVSILIFAGVAELVVYFGASILTAVGRPGLTFAIAGPLVPMAIVLQWFAIPSYGAPGAALVTTTLATIAAVTTLIACAVVAGTFPGRPVTLWAFFWSGVAVVASSLWAAEGWLVLLKIFALSLLVAAGLVVSGQLGRQELALLRRGRSADLIRDREETFAPE